MPAPETLKDVTHALAPPSQQNDTPPALPSQTHNVAAASGSAASDASAQQTRKTAAAAAELARGGTPNIPELSVAQIGQAEQAPATDRLSEPQAKAPPVSRAETRGQSASGSSAAAAGGSSDHATQFVRGQQKVGRNAFAQDPVVGWLVIVGGPGLGAFRPIFEGNNTVGRGTNNRIPLDFGDDSISSEEQAYVRYDPTDRSFLLVPNMSKTNVITHNESRPAQPVPLNAMDLITMGRTQLVFVPFCGADFDWAELSGLST